MSRPGPHRDDLIDAVASAVVGTEFARHYELTQFPRLSEAAALPGTHVDLTLSFEKHADFIGITGGLNGALVLTCQRCLQDVSIELNEELTLRLVADEEGAPAESEYEYVVANPARLDLRWLAEEQALLAMPLVPMHAPDECPAPVAQADAEPEQGIAQTPFANLRDVLKKG